MAKRVVGYATVFAIVAWLCIPNAASAAQCTGKQVQRTGPNGKTLTLCMDRKYSTCLRDSQRLGWSTDQAKRFCDGRKAAGAIN